MRAGASNPVGYMTAQAARVVVPVLGMHRSGTSLTTGLLSAFGVTLSEDLMPPTGANAMGYFESMGIREIQDELLAALGGSWDTSTTLKRFPDEWWRLASVQPFKARLSALVSGELQRVPGAWGFKDPRTARLLPLWNEIFSDLNLEPRYVIVGRHPAEVSKSLQTRDGLRNAQSELLWLEHMTDAVIGTKDRPAALVDYDRWFTDGVGQAKHMLGALGLPTPGEDALRETLERFVSAELRHHSAVSEACVLPYAREIHQALAARDRANLELLSDLFKVTATFTNKVVTYAIPAIR